MNLWETKIAEFRPFYWLVLKYIRYFPGTWLKEYLKFGVLGHSPRYSMFTNRDGIHFDLDLQDLIQKTIFCFHYFEANDVAVFRSFIQPGNTVFDVGANIGQYSMLASKLVGNQGKVYAFEPSPDVVKPLKHHLKINNCSNVDLVPKAVSSHNGLAEFYPANERGNQGVGSLLPSNPDQGQTRTESSVSVETITLDSFCEKHGIERVDLLKIDVEGYDLDVLKGAERLLSRCPHLVIQSEVEPENLVLRGFTPDDFIRYMSGHGFDAFYADDNGKLKAVIDGSGGQDNQNLFFLRHNHPQINR